MRVELLFHFDFLYLCIYIYTIGSMYRVSEPHWANQVLIFMINVGANIPYMVFYGTLQVLPFTTRTWMSMEVSN